VAEDGVVGDYVVSEKDMKSKEPFKDTIAVFPNMDETNPLMYMPYRCLIPRNVNICLLPAGRISSDAVTNDSFNLIHHCVCLGQAAGTAAAQSISSGGGSQKN